LGLFADSSPPPLYTNLRHAVAIQNYTKSVELDPKNQNGIDMLKKLKEQK